MKNKNIQLYLGDSKDILKQLSDNSIDCIVTDPPYQLDSIRERFGKKNSAPAKFGKDGAFQRASKGFMGKKWDVLPPIEVWKECLRVLKPGAFAFVMTTPRQDSLCQILMDLSQAGFCMGFSSIYWSYATGFPKASNISKKVDKRLGKKRKITGKDKSFGRHDSEVYELNKQGLPPKNEWNKYDEPASSQAKKLDGSYAGFQPKPAIEIILVVMKPLSEKTYVDQALKNGKGITWLDDCKIPYKTGKPESGWSKSGADGTKGYQGTDTFKIRKISAEEIQKNVAEGRFPANLIVSDGSLNDGKISKSTKSKANYKKSKPASIPAGCAGGTIKSGVHFGDKGSYSRYFDLDVWWKERIKKLPEGIKKVFPFLIIPKASKREKNKGLLEKGTGSNTYNRKCLTCGKWERKQGLSDKYTCHCEKPDWEKPKGNIHPTVKPIKLLSYLITLGSREGEIILDPFMGSGTTGIATKLLNRKFIGIERSEEYIKIAQTRIKGYNESEK